MECLAGIGALSAKATYSYNIENFKYDRWLRMKKEFQLMKFRNEQADLWREDVRDLTSLTEYKMHVYLLVNVLMLGFTICLYHLGRLRESTPDWMMMGHALSITGAFVFLILSIWMAMQAAVSAQAYRTRILTQLVRKPIPTWDELEACRTCASDFEKCEAKQMFRIPFLMGRQEDLVPTEPDDSAIGAPTSDRVDPWGLENSGNDISELGHAKGPEIAQQWHIKVTRQAMVYWQTYDAFARVSMSIGAIELLLALSYYVIGYIIVEADCWSAATYAVILFTLMAASLMHLDMSLSLKEARVIQTSGVLTAGLSCIAAYHWSAYGKEISLVKAAWFSEALIITAFFSHACFLAVATKLCQVQKHDNGSMLPYAYRSVLYLDVFGWMQGDDERGPCVSPRSQSTQIGSRSIATSFSALTGPSVPAVRENTQRLRPAAIQFDDKGTPIPSRPEDLIPPDAKEDLRHEDGAPAGSFRQQHRPGFFTGASWMQGEASRPAQRCRCGTLFMTDSLFCSTCGCRREVEEVNHDDDTEESFIVTGHESQAPGMLPWHVFSAVMVLMCLTWLGGGAYHTLALLELVDRHGPVVWDSDPGGRGEAEEAWSRKVKTHNSLRQSMLQLGIIVRHGHRRATHELENIAVVPTAWPHDNFMPQTLTCDTDGHRFVVTDRFNILVAEPYGKQRSVTKRGSLRGYEDEGLLRAGMEPFAADRQQLVNFTRLSCDALVGESVQDVALSCGRGGTRRGCRALVLHRNGRRISDCPLGSEEKGGTSADLSSSWLEASRSSASSSEKAVALTIDSDCWTGVGKLPTHCAGAFAATSTGRVVQLRQHSKRRELVPEKALEETGKSLRLGAVRMLRTGFLGILGENGKSMDVLDPQLEGKLVGRITFPDVQATSFCAGGGHLYFLGTGPSLNMYRIPLPSMLEA